AAGGVEEDAGGDRRGALPGRAWAPAAREGAGALAGDVQGRRPAHGGRGCTVDAPEHEGIHLQPLSVEARIVMMDETWDSIPAEEHPPLLTEAQRQELERRLAHHKANPDDVIPWEQIKAEALARFQR